MSEKNKTNIIEEKEKWVKVLQTLDQIEIKGQKNISLMFATMSFINNEINEIDKKLEEPKGE